MEAGRPQVPPATKDVDGESFVPYTHGQSLAEFTFKTVLTGALLGVMFGFANTYLGLTAGLTISTSIPVAVLTVLAFRALRGAGLKHTILELNMSQTVGSASSSVASGVLFTIPALFMWAMPPSWRQMTLLGMAGGLIGVLAMIPLRRYLIRREHGRLPYPEGMACAEVLVASEKGGHHAVPLFWGLGLGLFFKLLTHGFKLFANKFSLDLGFRKAAISISVSPALIGVGYILGPRIATVMVAGGALSALVIIPLIDWWGGGLTAPLFPETQHLIRDMPAAAIWDRYVRYIGAGAVATGGLITLVRSIPTMIESFRLGLAQIARRSEDAPERGRTDRDLSFRTLGLCLAAVLLVLTLVPGILGAIDSVVVRLAASVLIAVFAFFFVTVSSRIVGLVGVTSNPVSGMTIATLLGTSLVFLALGWTDPLGKATALMVGTVVCIAASIAGDTSQDLKTGFIVGATPRFQQIGEIVGVITSAGVVALAIQILHQGYAATGGLGGTDLPAPQSMLMKLVIDGVLDRNLPWNLILVGVGIAGVAALLRIPVLPFAVGVYLPLYTMGAVFLGGLLRWLLTRRAAPEEAEGRRERGVLVASGFVGGEGLTGVALAGYAAFILGGKSIVGMPLQVSHWVDEALALTAIGAIMALIALFARRRA